MINNGQDLYLTVGAESNAAPGSSRMRLARILGDSSLLALARDNTLATTSSGLLISIPSTISLPAIATETLLHLAPLLRGMGKTTAANSILHTLRRVLISSALLPICRQKLPASRKKWRRRKVSRSRRRQRRRRRLRKRK